MADVIGTISSAQGVADINLDNAATEATLKLLLQSSLANNKAAQANLAALAGNAGINPATVANAGAQAAQSQALGNSTTNLRAFNTAVDKSKNAFVDLVGFTEKLTSGSMQASDVFGAMKDLPFGIGMVASGLQKLAAMQEGQLKAYQVMTTAGVNFGGDLNKMRSAASNSFLTLEQFTGVVKKNSETFSLLGGNVNSGAEAFTKMDAALKKSSAGTQLLELGYTAEQVSNGMASYLQITGSRSTEELKNTKDITASSVAYMEQLDGLARITGKTREEADETMKAASRNAAFQDKLSSMAEGAEKDKATAALATATMQGKGAVEAFQSEFMGLAPITKASQMFVALQAEAFEIMRKSIANITDSSKSTADQDRLRLEVLNNYRQNAKNLDDRTKFALITQGSEIGAQVQAQQSLTNILTKKTNQEVINLTKPPPPVDKSAKDAVATQKEMFIASQKMLDAMLAAFGPLMPVVLALTQDFGKLADTASKIVTSMKTVTEFVAGNAKIAIGAVIAASIAGSLLIKAASKSKSEGGTIGAGLKTGGLSVAKRLAGGAGLGLGGLALGLGADALGRETTGGALAAAGSTALSGAAMGSFLGPIGAIVGGAAGAVYGAYENRAALGFGEKIKELKDVTARSAEAVPKVETAPAPAAVTVATDAVMMSELKLMNTNMEKLINSIREGTDYTKQNLNAIRGLNGDLFRGAR